MSVLDLIKATVFCGGTSFLVYSVPEISQVLFIGLMAALWLGYAYKAISNAMRRC